MNEGDGEKVEVEDGELLLEHVKLYSSQVSIEIDFYSDNVDFVVTKVHSWKMDLWA